MNKEPFKKMFYCEDCPCLNRDFYDGSSCNLGYVVDSFQVKGQEYAMFEFSDCSENCQLEVVKFAGGEFRPYNVEVYPREAETVLPPCNEEIKLQKEQLEHLLKFRESEVKK